MSSSLCRQSSSRDSTPYALPCEMNDCILSLTSRKGRGRRRYSQDVELRVAVQMRQSVIGTERVTAVDTACRGKVFLVLLECHRRHGALVLKSLNRLSSDIVSGN